MIKRSVISFCIASGILAGVLYTDTTTTSEPFDRGLYKHWIDADSDCQSTRVEVLIKESLIPVVLDASGCNIIRGKWKCPYTGDTFTDPRDLDVDHLVPLSEAHRSGADKWSPKTKQMYANDLLHDYTLAAVSASANRSKGGRDPSKWMPTKKSFHCEYLKRWVFVKNRFNLRMDNEEKQFIDNHPCSKRGEYKWR